MSFVSTSAASSLAFGSLFGETRTGRRIRSELAAVSKVVPGEEAAKCTLRFIIRLSRRLF